MPKYTIERTGGGVPAHLLQYEIEGLDELLDRAGNIHEEKNFSAWMMADMAALARELFPYHRYVNGKWRVDPIGRQIVGLLADRWQTSGETVRRYMALGQAFPPMVLDEDGEWILVRDHSKPLELYRTALRAESYGRDPLEMVITALDKNMSPGNLATYIREEFYRDNPERVPPTVSEFYHYRKDQPESPEEVLEGLLESVRIKWAAMEQAGKRPQWVEVRIRGLVPSDYDESDQQPEEHPEAAAAA